MWEEKLSFDLEYISNITFLNDVKIVFQTVGAVFKQEGITEDGMATAEDYGDYLLRNGNVTNEEYENKQQEAKMLMNLI